MKEPQETVTLPKGAWAAIVNALGASLQGPPRAVQALLNVVDKAEVKPMEPDPAEGAWRDG